jgi:hypothetical protein
MPSELVEETRWKPSPNNLVAHRPARMSKEAFVRICIRHFGLYGIGWKWRVAKIFGRSWNTVWRYSAGRRPIPRDIADDLWELDRLRDEEEAKIAAQTPEEKHRDFLRIIDSISALEPKIAIDTGTQESADAR